MAIISTAIAWALQIANDDTHGYDQGSREGPDYDCSSFICWAYYRAGLNTRPDGYSPSTSEMYDVFLAAGFKNVTSTVDLSTGSGLKPGDVLLRPGHHTEMMSDETHTVGAHENENGGVTGGKTGDQTGNEISVQSYRNKSYVYVLRYPERLNPPDPPDTSLPGCRMEVICGTEKASLYCFSGSPWIGLTRNGENAYWDFDAFKRLCNA